MIAKGIRVDGSFDCRIRTTSTLISGDPADPPQPVPTRAMPGRRLLRIMNNGLIVDDVRVNIQVVIGNGDVKLSLLATQGFGLDLDEFIELPFDDSIIVYAISEGAGPGSPADLRTIELR